MPSHISKTLSLTMTTVGIVTAISSLAFSSPPQSTQVDRSIQKPSSQLLKLTYQRHAQIPPPIPDAAPPGPPPPGPPPAKRGDWDRDYRRHEREDIEYCLNKDDRADRLECLDDARDRMRRRYRRDRRIRDRDEFPPYRS
jgi:hypothetical protein